MERWKGTLEWLSSEGVTPAAFSPPPKRYFRVCRNCHTDDNCSDGDELLLREVCDDLRLAPSALTRVKWLGSSDSFDQAQSLRFYGLPADAPLLRARPARDGRIYGMDVASGAAVAAVGALPGMRVLDLCCSPGGKLHALFDCLSSGGSPKSSGIDDPAKGAYLIPGWGIEATSSRMACKYGRSELHGVDVSMERMHVCRSLLEKALLWRRGKVDSSCSSYPGFLRATFSLSSRLPLLPPPSLPSVHVQLMLADGCSFTGDLARTDTELVFDSDALEEECVGAERSVARKEQEVAWGVTLSGARKRPRNKSARAREKKRLRKIVDEATITQVALQYDRRGRDRPLENATSSDQNGRGPHGPYFGSSCGSLYDRVLVDAECSHEGSCKHVTKLLRGHRTPPSFATCATTTTQPPSPLTQYFNAGACASLVILQRRLLLAGFRRLRRDGGGYLVYATCSLSRSQNEGVVRWFLATQPLARLVPVPFNPPAGAAPCVAAVAAAGEDSELFLPHVLRFDAQRTGTSGLFLARFHRGAFSQQRKLSTI
jgi:16S rRNA C967 or C1407 C5-methylase (RsmB/RsmF family)